MEEERDAARSSQNPLWVIYLIVFLGFIGISIPYLLFPALFCILNTPLFLQNPHHHIAPFFLGLLLLSIL